MENEIYRKRVYRTEDGKPSADGHDQVGIIVLTEELNCCLIWFCTEEYGPAVVWVGPSAESNESMDRAIEKAVDFGREGFVTLEDLVIHNTKDLRQYENY